jgi:hypothetical protein
MTTTYANGLHGLFLVAFAFQFFPSVSFSLTNMDTQPFAFIGAAFCVLVTRPSYPKYIWMLLIPAMAALSIVSLGFLEVPDITVAARSLITYFSPFIFAACAFQAVKSGFRLERYVRVAIWIWFLIGCTQRLINPLIFNFLVDTRMGSGGGVSGLAPEPSFYGLTIMLMWLLLYYLRPTVAMSKSYLFLVAFQVLFLSSAATASLVLLSAWAFWLMVNRPRVFVAAFAATVLGAFFLSNSFTSQLESVRVLAFLSRLYDDPSTVFAYSTSGGFDDSVASRFLHVYRSVLHAFSDFLVPHGLYAFSLLGDEVVAKPDFYLAGGEAAKIMSGFGSAMYEIGIFAVPYFLATFYLLRAQSYFKARDKFFIAIVLFGCYFNSVTLAAPHFGILLGIMAAKANISNRAAVGRTQTISTRPLEDV